MDGSGDTKGLGLASQYSRPNSLTAYSITISSIEVSSLLLHATEGHCEMTSQSVQVRLALLL